MIITDFKKSKILIENNLINNCGQFIFNTILPCKILIITDTNVSKIYVNQVKFQLENFNFKVQIFVIQPGEQSKTLKTLEKIYKILSLNFFSRSDAIVAIGGGIITDISGFAAATYKRGMKLINIPTSLLAQIDASIGGKNAVNSDYGKNLIGTFYHPDLVLIDPATLKTLPKNQINCGITEIIKYGCIKDEKLFKILENQNFEDNIYEIIYRSIIIKKEFVTNDEFDSGERMLLNFGHTIGHALEKLGNYKEITHGQAVAIGMNIITKISQNTGLTQKGTAERLSSVCKKYLLPAQTVLPSEKIVEVILNDKKISKNKLNLILLKNIGKSFIHKIHLSEITKFIDKRYI